MGIATVSGLISPALRQATTALWLPTSPSRKRTERVRFEVSIVSLSQTKRRPTPRRARFFTTSFPSAPAPPMTIVAPESFFWSHHWMRRRRW